MKKRISLTVVSVIALFVFFSFYNTFVEPMKASVAVNQLSDSAITYAVTRGIGNDFISNAVLALFVTGMIFLWITPVISLIKKGFNMKKLAWLLLLPILFIACGPALVEKFETIKPNETAYVIPVEGQSQSGQKSFMSVDFLEAKKVATKRIYLPQRQISTGRMWYDYKYIPTVDIIRVDRSPVTREWTGDSKTGTSKKNDSLWVESSDSIGFGVGVNLTAMVLEADTSLFLYKYAGKDLSYIVDNNVRGRVNAILSREFAKYTLEQGRDKKNEIINKVETETATYFKDMGITIANVGLAEGLVYEDKEIQKKINDNFLAQMDIQVKDNERLAQEKLNAKNISIAAAEATAAKEFAKAAEDRKKQMEIEVTLMEARAKLTMAQKWNGQMPSNILPSDSPLLMNLGK